MRPLSGESEGRYEFVAGARRFRASKIAGKQAIPATVREVTDAECREIQLIENLQRADIHELDEAFGYRALRELNPELYTVESIVAKVGKTSRYVYGCMKLVDLIPAVQTAFYEGKLTVAHALEIARLQPLCGEGNYVAFGARTSARWERSAIECHITLIIYSSRRNSISPLSRCHGFARAVCFTSQRASARAFVSRSISA